MPKGLLGDVHSFFPGESMVLLHFPWFILVTVEHEWQLFCGLKVRRGFFGEI